MFFLIILVLPNRSHTFLQLIESGNGHGGKGTCHTAFAALPLVHLRQGYDTEISESERREEISQAPTKVL
jgi:hypothetical protein